MCKWRPKAGMIFFCPLKLLASTSIPSLPALYRVIAPPGYTNFHVLSNLSNLTKPRIFSPIQHCLIHIITYQPGTCSTPKNFQPRDGTARGLLSWNNSQSLMRLCQVCGKFNENRLWHFSLLDDWGSHYEYRGCYKDNPFLYNRALRGYNETTDHNSLERCTHVCLNHNQGDTITVYK